jgi:glycosyltransferase involved in cell wall biosynthesis
VRIAIYHGYELTGSGSNEYTRYLSRSLMQAGHEVHVLCREPDPAGIAHVATADSWDAQGRVARVFRRDVEGPGTCSVHLLPHASVRPVYLTDKQRAGRVKSFAALTDDELRDYHTVCVGAVRGVLASIRPDVLHANHVLYQPVVAREACAATETPFVVYPHGSAIEYTLRRDARYVPLAEQGLEAATGWITGNGEVRDRILDLYPARREAWLRKHAIVGVGVDTSLFQPVERGERARSIAALPRNSFRGKNPAQRRVFATRLERGDLDALRIGAPYDQDEPDADLLSRLGAIPWDAPIVIYVGSLTAGKGVQSLLAAFPRVLHIHPDARLLVVGNGSYREPLEAFVHALATGNQGLLDHLVQRGFDLDRSDLRGPWDDVATFLRNPLARRDAIEQGVRLWTQVHFVGRLRHEFLARVFPCADVAVFPSVVPEAYPLVVMESLANGVVPVVSDFSGFADGLRDLEAHLGADLVDRMRVPASGPFRVERIAQQLISLLGDRSIDALRPRLRALAVRHFDWTVRAAEMTTAYTRFAVPPRHVAVG